MFSIEISGLSLERKLLVIAVLMVLILLLVQLFQTWREGRFGCGRGKSI